MAQTPILLGFHPWSLSVFCLSLSQCLTDCLTREGDSGGLSRVAELSLAVDSQSGTTVRAECGCTCLTWRSYVTHHFHRSGPQHAYVERGHGIFRGLDIEEREVILPQLILLTIPTYTIICRNGQYTFFPGFRLLQNVRDCNFDLQGHLSQQTKWAGSGNIFLKDSTT
ncbi:hypothetical protein B0T17DRAFT_539920 [Bombardia bombarda]|uniref:Uncharacterized protein n=1 Tax=Bombardia bombarda TaxID=252184 RepID=A0AA39WIJ0_9PEZI|nr:hypothetical protein B0T17DRAFT_539920 [Bombardia bombarda]